MSFCNWLYFKAHYQNFCFHGLGKLRMLLPASTLWPELTACTDHRRPSRSNSCLNFPFEEKEKQLLLLTTSCNQAKKAFALHSIGANRQEAQRDYSIPLPYLDHALSLLLLTCPFMP